MFAQGKTILSAISPGVNQRLYRNSFTLKFLAEAQSFLLFLQNTSPIITGNQTEYLVNVLWVPESTLTVALLRFPMSFISLSISFHFSFIWTHSYTLIATPHLFKVLVVGVPFLLLVCEARNISGSRECEPTLKHFHSERPVVKIFQFRLINASAHGAASIGSYVSWNCFWFSSLPQRIFSLYVQ